MLRPNLQRASCSVGRVKVVASMAVVDHEQVTARQFPRNFIQPVEPSEIYFGRVSSRSHWKRMGSCLQFRIGDRLLHENELVAFEADAFLQPG